MLLNLAGQVSWTSVVLLQNDIAKELHSNKSPEELSFQALNMSWALGFGDMWFGQ